MKKGFNPPRAAQSVCKLCDRLFAYFQRTKRRNFCDGCVEIERQAANVFFNELARRIGCMRARSRRKSMHRAFVRSALIGALPFILAWAFIATLAREIKSAFWYAGQEVLIECESFRKLWERAGA